VPFLWFSLAPQQESASVEKDNSQRKPQQPVRRSLEAVEYATLEWVDWFNNCTLLEPIGHVPPAEAETAYYAALEEPAALAA
jgi:transposase InsO family protein